MSFMFFIKFRIRNIRKKIITHPIGDYRKTTLKAVTFGVMLSAITEAANAYQPFAGFTPDN